MRAPILFTVASLFLIGSFSLPRSEELGSTRAIEDREADHVYVTLRITHKTIRLISNRMPEDWRKGDYFKAKHESDDSTSSTNTTKIKEREADHEYTYPIDHPWKPSGLYHIGSLRIGGKPISSRTNMRVNLAHRTTMLPKSRNAKQHRQASILDHRMACRTLPMPWPLINDISLMFSRWMEFRKYQRKHKGDPKPSTSTSTSTTEDSTTDDSTTDSTTGTGTNSTKVRMLKFRD